MSIHYRCIHYYVNENKHSKIKLAYLKKKKNINDLHFILFFSYFPQ